MSLSKPVRESSSSSSSIPLKDDFSKEYSLKELGVKPQEFPPDFFFNQKIPSCAKMIEYNLKNKVACDTTIIIGKEIFECHSIVLKVHTEYFIKLEEMGFSLKSVELPSNQVSMDSFCEIYNWMLRNNYEIPRPKFADIFKSAVFLKIKDLVKECMAIIDDKELIDERVAISVFLEAKKIDCRLLQSHMIAKISRIFLTFVASLDFLELSFEEVHEFFKSNGIAVNSEMDMLYVALRWLEFEWPKRKNCVKRLFKVIKFEVMPFWILPEIRKYPEKLAHIFCLVEDIIDDAMRDHSHRHAAEEGKNTQLFLQIFNNLIIGNIGMSHSRTHFAIPRKLIDDPKWKQLKLLDNPRVIEGYETFKYYLKQLNGTYWKKLKIVDDVQIAEEVE